MHKKLRFTKEGRSRKEIYKDGQYWDKINFGILEEEWKKKNEKNVKTKKIKKKS